MCIRDRSSSQVSASGRNSTCSAPSWTALTQTPASSRSSPSSSTPGRRGIAAQCPARSSPTRTSEASSQSSRGGAPRISLGSVPAAAQIRSRCSARASFPVRTSGRAGSGPPVAAWSVMGFDMAAPLSRCPAAHSGRAHLRKVRQPAGGPRDRARQPLPGLTLDGDPDSVLRVPIPCGQLGGCGGKRSPGRGAIGQRID